MKRYRIEFEIFEGQGGQLVKEGDQIIYPDNFETLGICAWMYRGDGQHSYQVGQRFRYPDDTSKLCPWLLSAMDNMIQTLRCSGTLPWMYEGTRYEKVIDPDGITTEFVHCPDPTSGIVVKLIRTAIEG
jgi:uncharacterized repeat protein (TIGR04076 family)